MRPLLFVVALVLAGCGKDADGWINDGMPFRENAHLRQSGIVKGYVAQGRELCHAHILVADSTGRVAGDAFGELIGSYVDCAHAKRAIEKAVGK